MKLIRRIQGFYTDRMPCVATIGNFDGLHQGHQQIIQQTRLVASKHNILSAVISFEPLPTEYFSRTYDRTPPTRIYPFRDKVRLLKNLEIDEFICLNFDKKISEMEPEAFIQDILVKQLNVRYLIVGDDFCFGKNRRGNLAMLESLGRELGMQVIDTQTIKEGNERVSSTRIRHQLAKGELVEANRLLGHGYQLSGRVRHGDKRGRTIGFPTLNLSLPEMIAAAKGVYAVHIHGLAEGSLKGVANIGMRPTVKGQDMRLEVHVFDYAEDAYGKHVGIELMNYIRAEKKFDGIEALKDQIALDAQQARDFFES